ncbi:MAG: hypothetical protein ACYT04_67970 [Nostoc sp.]
MKGDALLYETLRERRRLRVRPAAVNYAHNNPYIKFPRLNHAALTVTLKSAVSKRLVNSEERCLRRAMPTQVRL